MKYYVNFKQGFLSCSVEKGTTPDILAAREFNSVKEAMEAAQALISYLKITYKHTWDKCPYLRQNWEEYTVVKGSFCSQESLI